MVVDQFSDPVLANLARRVVDRPKLAAALQDFDVDPMEADKLPDGAFAWPEKRAFPLHGREHAMMSRAYREGLPGVPEYVDAAIKNACAVYQVDDALYARPKVAAVAPPSSDYLLPDIRRLSVTNADQVKTAEEKLRTEGSRLSVTHRALASANLVRKAASFGVRLRAETLKTAGLTVTDRHVLIDWLNARYEAAPLEHKEAYRKLAGAAIRLPEELRDRDAQIKLAEALQELDEAAGLDRHWGRRLLDPLMTVFNTTKVAGPGVTLAGRFVPMDRVAAYPSDFYSDILGPDIVREASDGGGQFDPYKLAAVLGTLPVDMQRVLSAQMR